MANEYALSYPRVIERGLLPVLSFIGLLLLIYVGLDAFSPPPEVTQYGGVPEASHGDVLRQICYLTVAVLIGATALQLAGVAAVGGVKSGPTVQPATPAMRKTARLGRNRMGKSQRRANPRQTWYKVDS